MGMTIDVTYFAQKLKACMLSAHEEDGLCTRDGSIV